MVEATHETREVGIQTALILALVNGRELRVLNATAETVDLESVVPLPDRLSVALSIFNLPKWEYVAFRFEDARVVSRQQLTYSETVRVELGERNEAYATCLTQLHSMWETGLHRDGTVPAAETHAAYDARGQRRSFSTIDQQRRSWFAPKPDEAADARFSRLASRVELAFSARTPLQYEAIERRSCDEAIEQTLERLGLQHHGLFQKGPWRRLYVGNELCEHLCPSTDRLLLLLESGMRAGLSPTVVSPILMEHNVSNVADLLRRLEAWNRESNGSAELVVNDWGTFTMLKEHAPSIKPLLGKLLNKRKKDPRVKWYWGHERHSSNLEGNNLGAPGYRRFLSELGVERYELEGGPMRASVPSAGHSLHFPYYYTNASVFCMLYAEVTEFYARRQRLVKRCPQYCMEFGYAYPDRLGLVGKGNALFGFDAQILVDPTALMDYIDSGIDRLVFMADC